MKIIDAIKTATLKQENVAVKELDTPWTSQVNAHNVWQEYPRPQMVRDSYKNLNGLWEYAMLDTIPAFCQQAMASDMTDSDSVTSCHRLSLDRNALPQWQGQILVPFSPEAPLSGVKRQLMPGQTLCYQRSFSADDLTTSFAKDSSADKKPEGHLLLHFGAVDQRCQIYVNHQLAGCHEGGYLPFTLDITAAVTAGENTLLVFCQDDSDTSYHTRGKQMIQRGGMFYTAQSGIWQTVWLEWVPAVYIEKLKLTPDYDHSQIRIGLTMAEASAKASDLCYRVHVSYQGKEVAQLSTDSAEMVVPVPDFLPWTPEDPCLYDLTVEVCSSQTPHAVVDRITSYFAMRCVTVEQDEAGIVRLCLNHKPYFQHGLLDQGYWPDGLLTAPCDEALIYDIRTMKDAGFNMLRKHCKLEPLRWYYHCDRLGMLVWQDITNGGSSYDMFHLCYRPTILPFTANGAYDREKGTGRTDPASHDEWYRECRTTMEHLYNCPSLVSWVVFNEGWGQFDTENATAFAKSLDPTRTFDQASGWFDHQGGDMKSVHNYFRKLVCPPTNTTSEEASGANLCGKRAAVISEYGGLALPLPGHITTDQVYGYKNLKSLDDFQTRFQAMMEHILSLEADGLSAAVYTQVSDIEDEVNGLLTYDRRINKITEPAR